MQEETQQFELPTLSAMLAVCTTYLTDLCQQPEKSFPKLQNFTFCAAETLDSVQ